MREKSKVTETWDQASEFSSNAAAGGGQEKIFRGGK
jgi:hypothetical protein